MKLPWPVFRLCILSLLLLALLTLGYYAFARPMQMVNLRVSCADAIAAERFASWAEIAALPALMRRWDLPLFHPRADAKVDGSTVALTLGVPRPVAKHAPPPEEWGSHLAVAYRGRVVAEFANAREWPNAGIIAKCAVVAGAVLVVVICFLARRTPPMNDEVADESCFLDSSPAIATFPVKAKYYHSTGELTRLAKMCCALLTGLHCCAPFPMLAFCALSFGFAMSILAIFGLLMSLFDQDKLGLTTQGISVGEQGFCRYQDVIGIVPRGERELDVIGTSDSPRLRLANEAARDSAVELLTERGLTLLKSVELLPAPRTPILGPSLVPGLLILGIWVLSWQVTGIWKLPFVLGPMLASCLAMVLLNKIDSRKIPLILTPFGIADKDKGWRFREGQSVSQATRNGVAYLRFEAEKAAEFAIAPDSLPTVLQAAASPPPLPTPLPPELWATWEKKAESDWPEQLDLAQTAGLLDVLLACFGVDTLTKQRTTCLQEALGERPAAAAVYLAEPDGHKFDLGHLNLAQDGLEFDGLANHIEMPLTAIIAESELPWGVNVELQAQEGPRPLRIIPVEFRAAECLKAILDDLG